jgi:hypothetical protein
MHYALGLKLRTTTGHLVHISYPLAISLDQIVLVGRSLLAFTTLDVVPNPK